MSGSCFSWRRSDPSFSSSVKDGHHGIVISPQVIPAEELEDVQRYGAGVAYMLTAGKQGA